MGHERASASGDLILLATGPDGPSCDMARNTLRMLRALRLSKHTMLLADSLDTCERVGFDGCYWSSDVFVEKPSHSISIDLYWDWCAVPHGFRVVLPMAASQSGLA